MLSAALEILAEIAVYAWPWGEPRWWKLSLTLAVALVVSVAITIWLAN